MSVIVITGGSGLIGRRLTALLLKEGHTVRWLTRKKSGMEGVTEFLWNPSSHQMDDAALDGADAVISLAGTPIAARRWSESFKKDIIQSRIDAAQTLLKSIARHPDSVRTLVCASATGFYGDGKDELMEENRPAGKGFLADTTAQWEAAYHNSNIRTVIYRIGIVLSDKGGALKELATPLKTGVCPVIGSGRQYMSWIHIDDLCRLFLHAINQTSLKGTFNAVAPEPVTHKQFMFTLRKVIRPFSLVVHVPSLLIRLLLGEKSVVVLDSTRVSALKTISSDFRYLFTSLEAALKDIYGKK